MCPRLISSFGRSQCKSFWQSNFSFDTHYSSYSKSTPCKTNNFRSNNVCATVSDRSAQQGVQGLVSPQPHFRNNLTLLRRPPFAKLSYIQLICILSTPLPIHRKQTALRALVSVFPAYFAWLKFFWVNKPATDMSHGARQQTVQRIIIIRCQCLSRVLHRCHSVYAIDVRLNCWPGDHSFKRTATIVLASANRV